MPFDGEAGRPDVTVTLGLLGELHAAKATASQTLVTTPVARVLNI
ncbi:MAG TPA: hypothetical protein VG222_11850 [Vicinamibacterales bacterium]|nr:hypothetical protein [Vicinamibacterales bacterium]